MANPIPSKAEPRNVICPGCKPPSTMNRTKSAREQGSSRLQPVMPSRRSCRLKPWTTFPNRSAGCDQKQVHAEGPNHAEGPKARPDTSLGHRPREPMHQEPSGLKARPHWRRMRIECRWMARAFSPRSISPGSPGAMPQADMARGRWPSESVPKVPFQRRGAEVG